MNEFTQTLEKNKPAACVLYEYTRYEVGAYSVRISPRAWLAAARCNCGGGTMVQQIAWEEVTKGPVCRLLKQAYRGLCDSLHVS